MRRLVLNLILLIIATPASAEQVTGMDEQAQLPFWEWRSAVLSLRFVQRLPDQSRAYFAGRGFQEADTKFIASHCIFQTVFKNVAAAGSQHVVEYDLDKWRVVFNGQQLPLKKREVWPSMWQERKTKPAQKIAFEWSLLPTLQRYQPSDYNWGMTVFPLAHGSVFDLLLSWQVDGKPQQATIKNMQCAKDIYIEPPAE